MDWIGELLIILGEALRLAVSDLKKGDSFRKFFWSLFFYFLAGTLLIPSIYFGYLLLMKNV